MAFGKKTASGQKKKQELQESYKKWWLGKEVYSKSIYNGIPAIGTIVDVEFIGDSFQGCVKIILSNGCEAYVTGAGHKPLKEDLVRI